MEQQASLHREYSQCKQEPLTDDSFSQIAAIFSGVDHQHLAGLRHPAKIHAQAAQISPEDAAPLLAEPAAHPRRKPRL